jgi:hypothetical protein
MVKVKSDTAVEIDGTREHEAVEREEVTWLENLIWKSEGLVVA